MPASVRRVISRDTKIKLKSAYHELVLSHNTIYDDVYFDDIERTAASSAPVMAETIVDYFRPTTVLDVGCGSGALLSELSRRGVRGMGLEYSEAALAYCRRRNLHVLKFDLESGNSLHLKGSFDLVITLEVAEHLPAQVADRYVSLLCSHADNIIFSAAPPGQGGKNHINEQPASYWIRKFSERGFVLTAKETEHIKTEWKSMNVSDWYHENLIVFGKA